jgi:hypothetical protein
LEKLIFVGKNWRSVPRIDCKSPSNLVKFIDIDGDLEKEEFESSFEWDEVVDL